MNKIEHIGIAVSDLKAACSLYEKLLNTKVYKVEDVLSENVKTAFLQSGPNKIELLEALSNDSPIAKFIATKGGGIHHIAFEVEDIRAEMARLKQQGFILLNEEPKLGADSKLVCFVHPKSAGGVLVELCESIDFPSKTKLPDLTVDEQLNLFQFRNKLVIPDDLIAYFKLTNSEIEGFDGDMFTFYKFDEFKSIKEEVEDSPEHRGLIDSLPSNANCFVFAEWMIRSSLYVIRLHNNKCDVNEIYITCGPEYRIVANSFNEFIELYKEDINNVLF